MVTRFHTWQESDSTKILKFERSNWVVLHINIDNVNSCYPRHAANFKVIENCVGQRLIAFIIWMQELGSYVRNSCSSRHIFNYHCLCLLGFVYVLFLVPVCTMLYFTKNPKSQSYRFKWFIKQTLVKCLSLNNMN